VITVKSPLPWNDLGDSKPISEVSSSAYSYLLTIGFG